ncbi:MAG: hypothetical protein ABGY95_03655 [Rubritalea sp.]|uniref:hypothetical protein n=1 Tax=Rubritalea sp. TaxID=2109375 RepID=UPI003241CAB8
MKPLHFLTIAAAGALSSCGSMHDPIYYGNGEAKPTKVSQLNAPPVAQGDAATSAPTNVTIANKKPQGLKRTSPFMQPNVFDIPKNDDLKETATSTRSNAGNSGLTVPN